ncbi:MAG: SLC13 family permease [Gammaproteobacteria bacterium]|nr:MAG: SLC13 family permease [Gammaproteobacteria bacterium]
MSWEAWFTLAVVALCFGLLVRNRAPPDIAMAGGLTLLLISGVLTPAQALAGFANEGMVTVGVLYVVVTGIRETGGIGWIVQKVLGQPRSLGHAQLKMMVPTALMSAFLNNTPVVAMFIPAVKDWAKRHRLSVSSLMIPLSYAAIIGGTCTLIGTSTNLVVNGLLLSETGGAGLGMFDIARVGVPALLVALLYVVLASKWLLPERQPVISQFDNAREYTVQMSVEANSPLVGTTITEAGLRQLPGLYLIEVERRGRVIPAVPPEERLEADDRLLFAGVVESIVDLHKIRGLRPATDQVLKIDTPRDERRLIEAVVSNTCPVVGKSIRQGRFRDVYNAAIVGVARNGQRIKQKIGDIVLRPGDTLLLVTRPSFAEQQRNSRDFFLVSLVEDTEPMRHDKALAATLILLGMVLLVASGLLSMLQAAMLAAGLMIVTRCTRGRIARRAVDWQVLVVIGASFGIGTALQATGAAQTIAASLIALTGDTPVYALASIYLITALFSAVITNNVAAVVMFPIALAAADTLQVSFTPFAISIMMAASASFATPIGYQTNLMVYGVGGYRFNDYLRMGVPLTVLVGLVTVLLAPLWWPF